MSPKGFPNDDLSSENDLILFRPRCAVCLFELDGLRHPRPFPYGQRTEVGIALVDLPVMFRDVVYVFRQLDLRYVWIDCLCIIQDSDSGDDWR